MQYIKLIICYIFVIPIGVISSFPYPFYKLIEGKESQTIMNLCKANKLDSMGIFAGIFLLILSFQLVRNRELIIRETGWWKSEVAKKERTIVIVSGNWARKIGYAVFVYALYQLVIGVRFWFFLYFPAW